MELIWQTHRIKHEKIEMEGQEQFKIKNPSDVGYLLYEELADLDREMFVLMTLNVKNVVTSFSIIHIGGINASLVDVTLVFKTAVLHNAKSIIVAHNHPSGDLKPSREDIEVTERLSKAGAIMGIELLDHVIFGGTKTVSLKSRGLF